MSKSQQWQILSAVENFAKFRDQWDALNRSLLHNHPLGDSCFVEPLLHYFGGARDYLALLTDGENCHSMLLLSSSRFGVLGSFCPSQTELCPILIDSLAHIPSLISELPASNLALQLFRQDPDYCVFPNGDGELNYDVETHAITVSIDLQGRFEDYWRQRSTKLRRNIGRAFRVMAQRDYAWSFRVLEEPQEVVAAVDRYGDLEIRGWKNTEGTAVHSSNEQGRFYRETMQRFSEKGLAIVYELYFGDELVSSQLAIGNETILITLKTTYNEQYSEFSPGKLLDYLMLEHEFKRAKYARIEFCTNAGPELVRWGTSTRPVSDITIFRGPLAHRGAGVYHSLKNLGTPDQ